MSGFPIRIYFFLCPLDFLCSWGAKLIVLIIKPKGINDIFTPLFYYIVEPKVLHQILEVWSKCNILEIGSSSRWSLEGETALTLGCVILMKSHCLKCLFCCSLFRCCLTLLIFLTFCNFCCRCPHTIFWFISPLDFDAGFHYGLWSSM